MSAEQDIITEKAKTVFGELFNNVSRTCRYSVRTKTNSSVKFDVILDSEISDVEHVVQQIRMGFSPWKCSFGNSNGVDVKSNEHTSVWIVTVYTEAGKTTLTSIELPKRSRMEILILWFAFFLLCVTAGVAYKKFV